MWVTRSPNQKFMSFGKFMAYFWLIAGFMAGVAAAFFVVRLWVVGFQRDAAGSRRTTLLILVSLSGFLLISGAMYFYLGRPEMVGVNTSASVDIANHPVSSDAANGPTASMTEAAEKLAKRLAADSGSDQDWLLLQQSYEFLGDTEGAELAQKHQTRAIKQDGSTVANAEQGSANQVAARAVADQAAMATYQQMVAQKPTDADSWLAIAQIQRTARNFAESSAAFQKVIELKAMTADAWSDYADVSATLAKTLTNNATRAALDAALKLDPKHSKALWLKASLAHEEKRYAEALKLWQQLRAVIPNNSPDVTIVDANIKEAQSLVGMGVTNAVNQQEVRVSGSVAIDQALRNSVSPDMVLFVYAKASDSPMPVAVFRTTVGSWPMSFVLDDSQAMMPSRKLSQFQTVTLSARLSRSGQAMAQSGDLQTDSVSVNTVGSKSVELRINKRIP